ncbi:enoyl-CoA hydratase-related protein [Microbacterium sp. X-17]|uniref:enoyl-CoA hydratase/isomerase family protein n=1 Tax=Microbacterium sp. X-17 TaxID=3144404 RepID=UPI0031F495B3
MSDDGEAEVLTDLAGGVLTVTINRPHRKNALSPGVRTGLIAAIDRAEQDPDVRVLVLTGAGGDFCAGADMAGDSTGRHPLRRMQVANEIALTLHHVSVPTIAKVQGVAIGAGCNLALGCDFVVAARSARFSEMFGARGLSIDFAGSWLLPKIVGLQRAKRLVMLGEIIGGEEAERLGLATYVTDDDALDETVARLTESLLKQAPVALAQSKALLHEGATRTLQEALESEARAQTINFGGTDASAALDAFREKRDAEFTGGWRVP